MSVRIEGLKYLEENDYSRIIIKQVDGNYKVKVCQTQQPLPKIKGKNELHAVLRGLNDENKVEAIIKKFIDNNKISSVSDYEFIGYYEDCFDVFKNNYRGLFLSVYNDKLLTIFKECYKNFLNNREQLLMLDNNNHYVILKDLHSSTIDIQKDETVVRLVYDNNGLKKNELKFLEKLVDYKLKEQGEHAYYGSGYPFSRGNNGRYSYFCLQCGSFIMNINDDDIYHYVAERAKEYNAKRNEELSKCKQLKLDI